MLRASVVLVVLGLAGPLLSGCLSPPATDAEPLVRTVRLDLDPRTAPEMETPRDMLRQFRTTFTYTQGDGTLTVSRATVAFTGVDGQAVSRPLSAYTSESTLSKGDAITIEGAAMTSGFSLSEDGSPVASRAPRTAPWLIAEGTPIPLAAADGGLALYRIEARSALGFSFDRLAMTEDGESQSVTDLKLDAHSAAEGTLALASRAEGPALNVSLAAHLTSTSDLVGTAMVSQPEASGPAGVRYNGHAALDGTAALLFAEGALSKAGAGGSVLADATLLVREPGEAEYSEEGDLEHPVLDETLPFTWETEETPSSQEMGGSGEEGLTAQMRTLLLELYGLDLVPGDRFTLHVASSEGGYGGELGYDLVVAGAQDRTVAGHTFHALKLQGTYSLAFRLDGRSDTARSFAFTYWIDGDTMLPLDMSWEAAISFSKSDLSAVWAAVRSFGQGVEVPEALQMQATGKGSVLLTSFSPGLQTSALNAVGGATSLWIPMAAASYVLAANLRGMDSHSSAPELSVVKDATAARLTIVAAGDHMPYGDLRLTADFPVHVAFEPDGGTASAGPGDPLTLDAIAAHDLVLAGDALVFCGSAPVNLTLVDVPSNTLLYVTHLDHLPAC
ncbi:MAG TPA: hypothetical protein VM286_01790 [Candidatus Thermoplasmatota archaeon]|nr:hypothetical protein [Candidatus Thermoplasmatota archaeon]